MEYRYIVTLAPQPARDIEISESQLKLLCEIQGWDFEETKEKCVKVERTNGYEAPSEDPSFLV